MRLSNTCLGHHRWAAGSSWEAVGPCLSLGSSRNLKSHKRINEKFELIDRKTEMSLQSSEFKRIESCSDESIDYHKSELVFITLKLSNCNGNFFPTSEISHVREFLNFICSCRGFHVLIASRCSLSSAALHLTFFSLIRWFTRLDSF